MRDLHRYPVTQIEMAAAVRHALDRYDASQRSLPAIERAIGDIYPVALRETLNWLTGWEQIADAPTDGRALLFGGRFRPFDHLPGGEWTEAIFRWTTLDSFITNARYEWLSDGFHNPDHWHVDWTHWHPLPAPPDHG